MKPDESQMRQGERKRQDRIDHINDTMKRRVEGMTLRFRLSKYGDKV